MRLRLTATLVAGLVLTPAPLLAQSDCDRTRLSPAPAPASITRLQRQGYAAYLNNTTPDGQKLELHLVGSYEGSGSVHVDAGDKPIVLLLAAYAPGLWRIEVAEGARLERIVLLGAKPQRVSGVGPGVEIVDRSGCGDFAYKWEGRNRDVSYMPDEYKRFRDVALAAAGLVETSFQGHYGLGAAYVVPPSETQYSRAQDVAQPAQPRASTQHDRDSTLAVYDAQLARAPADVRATMSILVDMIRRDRLPFVFPVGDPGPDPNAPGAVRRLFEGLDRPSQVLPRSGECGALVRGTPAGSTVKCGWGNQFYVMGNGQDVIDDSWGDDIANPGGGDDVVDLGWGNDILVLERGWGDDIVGKTCHHAQLSDADRARLGWRHRYTSFIVFGPGVSPADMRWEAKNILVHAPSNSRLTLKDACFNLVFSDDGDLLPYQPPPPPVPVPAHTLTAEEIRAEQARRQEQYLASRLTAGQPDVTIEVDRATFERVENQGMPAAAAGMVRVVRRDNVLLVAFVSQMSRGLLALRLRD